MVKTMHKCVKNVFTGIMYLYHYAPKKYDLSFMSKHNKKLSENKEINLSPLFQRRLLIRKKKLSSLAKGNHGGFVLKSFEHIFNVKYVFLGVGAFYYGLVLIQKKIEEFQVYVINFIKFSWLPKPDMGAIKSGVSSFIPARETIYGWCSSVVNFTKSWIPKPDVGKIITAVYSYFPKKETIYDSTKVVVRGVMSGVSWTYSKGSTLFGGKKEE